MAVSERSRASVAGRWMLAALVPFTAMAIGSLHPTTLVIVTAFAAVTALLLWLEPPRRTTASMRWVLAGAGLLIAATVIQSLPLPASLAATIAPANADVWARSLTPLREAGPAWHPITLAPPATHVELLKGTLYLLVYLAAARVALDEGGTRFLEAVVLGSASLIALVTLAHNAVHAETVFGFYKPHDTLGFEAGRLGPLLNPNHVAAYVNIGALVAMRVSLERGKPLNRLVAGAAALLLAGTSVWAASRGGTGTLVLGAVLVVGLVFYTRRNRRTQMRLDLVLMGVAVIAAAGLVGLSASDLARQDLTDRDLSKLQLAKSALVLVRQSPVFGSGRGAFETVFPSVYHSGAYFTFIRVENVAVQWLVDWGVPVAVAAFGAFAYALRPSVLLSADRPPIGAWVAIVVTVLHDLVDFHLEVPGVVVLAMACVAIVTAARPASSESRRSSSAKRRSGPSARTLRIAAALAGGLALVAAIAVVPNRDHPLWLERDAIAKAATDPAVSTDSLRGDLRAAMTRYPAEPFFPLAGAVRAQRDGDPVVIAWIGRALERYPRFGRAHLVLARSLAPRFRAQARLEYRLAYTDDQILRSTVLREASPLVVDRDSAMELVADGSAGVDVLEGLASGLADRLPASAAQLDVELRARDPGAPGPLRRAVQAATSDIANEHGWCADRRKCAADAITGAEQLVARDPNKCEPHVLLARVRIAAGRQQEALDALQKSVDTSSERGTCMRELVKLSIEAGDRKRIDTALESTLKSGCGTRDECVSLYVWAASIDESRGNLVRGISFYKRASDLAPENESHLEHAAALAERAGLHGEAADAYTKLALRHPENPQWLARAEALRRKSQETGFSQKYK